MGPKTRRLIQRVALRRSVVSLACRFRLYLLVLAGVYAALLLASRLLGIIPNYFAPSTSAAVAGLACVLAAALYRRPRAVEAARAVDRAAGSKDLYLTAVLIGTSAGEYQPLVMDAAEARADAIHSRGVAPIRWEKPALHCVLAVGLLWAGAQWLPQLDPFGRQEQRRQAAERRKELRELRKVTAMRAERLKRRNAEARHSDEVNAALEKVKADFQAMKKGEPKGNFKRLQAARTHTSELWRKKSEQRMKALMDQKRSAAQRFGGNASKMNQWREQMKAGDPSGLKKEIDELKKAAEKLKSMPEGAEKEKLREEMRRRLDDLQQFAQSNLGQNSAAACRQAAKAMAMAGQQGLSQEALEALSESLDMMKGEFSGDMQAMRDLQGLEEALKALRSAQGANEKQPLDGEMCGSCQSMADYEALYNKIMSQCAACSGEGCAECQGLGYGQGGWAEGDSNKQGLGFGGPGKGRGGSLPEDDSAFTAFKTQKSPAALQAGKVLLQWKVNEVSQAGDAPEDYDRKVQLHAVKAGVSEAILHEQVPAGYHEDIQTYFDTMVEAEKEEDGD